MSRRTRVCALEGATARQAVPLVTDMEASDQLQVRNKQRAQETRLGKSRQTRSCCFQRCLYLGPNARKEAVVAEGKVDGSTFSKALTHAHALRSSAQQHAQSPNTVTGEALGLAGRLVQPKYSTTLEYLTVHFPRAFKGAHRSQGSRPKKKVTTKPLYLVIQKELLSNPSQDSQPSKHRGCSSPCSQHRSRSPST